MPRMSTIDPVEAERIRVERLKGSGRAAIELGAAVLGLLAAGAFSGYALVSFLDPIRAAVLNIFISYPKSSMAAWLVFPAPIASIIAVSLYRRASRRYLGRPGAAAGQPARLWLIGFAIGSWYGGLDFTKPDAIGVSRGPAFGENTRWGTGAWIFYHAWWWLPTLATLLSLAAILAGIAGRVRRRRREALIADLLVSGRRTPGEVTSAASPPGVVRQYPGSWTVKFTDLHGQNRWVTRTERFSADAPPLVGDAVTVLYDPNAPGDTTRIFLARDNDASPVSYLDQRPVSP
jgi:uncharacterized protein DUF3592